MSRLTKIAANATSLPSTEESGAQPSEKSGGVGALPGRISEAGVAQLPEERVVDTGNASTANLHPRYGLALAREKGLNARANEGRLSSEMIPHVSDVGSKTDPSIASPQNLGASLPSNESSTDPSVFTSSGGVGALPGSSGESGVAVLPEERAASTTNNALSTHEVVPGTLLSTAAAGQIAQGQPQVHDGTMTVLDCFYRDVDAFFRTHDNDGRELGIV